MDSATGRIVELQRTKGYGFFQTKVSRERIFFNFADKVEPEDILTEGDVVEAKVAGDGKGRRRALNIRRRRTAL